MGVGGGGILRDKVNHFIPVGEGKGHCKGWALTYITHNIQYRIQNTEYRIQLQLKLMYIKLPMYLLFYMALLLDDFHGGKSITRTIKRGEP